MTILWINLAIVFIFSFFARYFATVTITSDSTLSIKPNKYLILGALLSLVIVSGLRANIGDTGAYKEGYIVNDFTWENIMAQKDIGFGVLQRILKNFSNDPQILLFTTALITNALIILVFYKYSRLFELSVYVLITNGFFITSMNGVRQCLAAAIAFAGTKFLVEGSWKQYFLVVLFASTMHQTALILIPIYFIVRRRAWTGTTFSLILFSIIIVIGFNQFTEVLFAAIKDSHYAEYKDYDEGGANVIRAAVEFSPLLIAFIGREKLRAIMPNSDYFVNLSIISFIFMVIATQNWIFARFSIYFSLYQLILISWIVELFTKKNQRLIYYAILILFFIYHYYDSVIILNIWYRSNFIDITF